MENANPRMVRVRIDDLRLLLQEAEPLLVSPATRSRPVVDAIDRLGDAALVARRLVVPDYPPFPMAWFASSGAHWKVNDYVERAQRRIDELEGQLAAAVDVIGAVEDPTSGFNVRHIVATAAAAAGWEPWMADLADALDEDRQMGGE